ncbi:MAG TPA: hypothetical protein VK453_25775 [Micromonosporaceae bacterium]|nr:hypothetical protein [Micromonosporaceae bacterium]
MATNSAEKIAAPARRGDLVVIERVEHDCTIGRDYKATLQFDVMVVSNIFRDGRIKAVRRVNDNNDDPGQPIDRMVGFSYGYLIAAASVDKAAVIEAVRAHHWPGYPGLLKSFDSLDEVKAIIQPHRHSNAA